MEERLNAIGIDQPSTSQSSGVKQPPKADTLALLLSQGLQSRDKSIITVSMKKSDIQDCAQRKVLVFDYFSTWIYDTLPNDSSLKRRSPRSPQYFFILAIFFCGLKCILSYR